MTPWPGDQPLLRFAVLESSDIESATAAMTRVYGEMNLTANSPSDPFGLRLCAAPVGPLLITSHYWASGITANSPGLDGCFDFCTALHGGGEIHIGNQPVEFSPQRGVVMAAIHPMDCRSSGAMTSLNLKIPGEVAQAHMQAATGSDASEPIDFRPAMPLEGESLSAHRLLKHVVAELDRNARLLDNPLVMERFSETLLACFLCSQPSNYSSRLRRDARAAEPPYVARIEEYLRAHCDQPITARQLAEIAGVSMSALYAGFKRHRGCPPLEFLKRIRLDRVRDSLLTAEPGDTVGQVAARWGFPHPGRFSREYGRRFGEAPSETLRRATRRD